MREKRPEQRQKLRKLTLRRAAQDDAVAAIDKPCLARVNFISIHLSSPHWMFALGVVPATPGGVLLRPAPIPSLRFVALEQQGQNVAHGPVAEPGEFPSFSLVMMLSSSAFAVPTIMSPNDFTEAIHWPCTGARVPTPGGSRPYTPPRAAGAISCNGSVEPASRMSGISRFTSNLVRVPQGRKLGHQRVVRTPEPIGDLFRRQPGRGVLGKPLADGPCSECLLSCQTLLSVCVIPAGCRVKLDCHRWVRPPVFPSVAF